jgi:hypothetical protein
MNLGFRTRARKTENVKSVLASENLDEATKATLSWNLNVEKFVNYGTRLSVMPLLVLLYRKKFFESTSTGWSREGFFIVGFLGYIYGGDFAANWYLWNNCVPIVKDYRKSRELELRSLYQKYADSEILDGKNELLIDDE